MKKFEQAYEGEWICPKRKYYYIRCCDCGLVHKIEFDLLKDKLGRSKIVYRTWRATKKEINAI